MNWLNLLIIRGDGLRWHSHDVLYSLLDGGVSPPLLHPVHSRVVTALTPLVSVVDRLAAL